MSTNQTVDLELLPAQFDFCTSPHPYPAISGGLGSGKTEAEILRLASKMMLHPGINTLIGMPTYDLLKLRAIPGAEDIFRRIGLRFSLNKSDYFIEVHGFGKMYFRSFDNPSRWVAFEVGHTVLDELDTLKRDDAEVVWRKATERTRQKAPGMVNTIGVVTTPDMGIHGFVCEKWGGNDNTALPDGYHLIFADTRDNYHLPAGYYDQIMSNYDPLLAEMYTRGRFVNLTQDKVYHYFNRETHHTDRQITDADAVLYVAIDFNVGGCCGVTFVIDDNQPRAVDEFVSRHTADFIQNLAALYPGKQIVVTPDASGGADSTNASASDIAMIAQAGHRIDCPTKNPFIRNRVNAVNGLLSHGKWLVNTNKCPRLTDALESQGYTDRGEPEKFRAHPSVDDWVDAAGYFISHRWPVDVPVVMTGIGSAG